MLEHAVFANTFDDVFEGQPISLHSSNICCVLWEDELKELTIHFVNGGLYTYVDVPRWRVRAMLLAKSAGHYFTTYIRNRYVWVKEEKPMLHGAVAEAM